MLSHQSVSKCKHQSFYCKRLLIGSGECLDVNMYELVAQMDSNAAPHEVKRVKREEVTHPDGGQDTTVNESEIKE